MKPGDKLHTFTILEDLGHGGMGGVYIGFDSRTKQLVAIKTLFQEFSRDEAYVRRFQREAMVYRKLDHPNIVKFVDSGFENGIYFIAMEHIKGKPLDVILKEVGRLSVEHAVKIMGHLADGIAHAHSKGIIHRDIKPQNIMISEAGEVKILDFGIAQADDNLVKTVTGSILGTFYYASPEQNQGKKIDERSDLYSLGLVFYEMLTGERALKGSTLLEVTAFQMRNAIPPPSTIVADIPPALDKIVMKLLEKDPDERYESADALIEDLQAFKENPNFDPTADFDDEEIAMKWQKAQDAFLRRELDLALDLAKEVAEKYRNKAEVFLLLGKIYAAKKIKFEASENFSKALKLDPDNDEYKLDYAIALFNLENYKKSKQLLKEYLDKDPDNIYAKRYLNRIYEIEKKQQEEEEKQRLDRLKLLAKHQQNQQRQSGEGNAGQAPAPRDSTGGSEEDGEESKSSGFGLGFLKSLIGKKKEGQ